MSRERTGQSVWGGPKSTIVSHSTWEYAFFSNLLGIREILRRMFPRHRDLIMSASFMESLSEFVYVHSSGKMPENPLPLTPEEELKYSEYLIKRELVLD